MLKSVCSIVFRKAGTVIYVPRPHPECYRGTRLSRLRTAWIDGQLDGVSIGIGDLFEPSKFLSTRRRTHLDGHLSSGSDDALPQHGLGQSVLRTHVVRREGLDRPRRFSPVLRDVDVEKDVRVDPF